MYLLLHIHIASPIINIPHDRQTFVTTDEPMLAHLYHLKSMVYIRVHPWCYILYGFGSIYSNVATIIVIQSGFHCPKNPLCSTYSSLLPSLPLGTNDFYWLLTLAFTRMANSCNHTVCRLFRKASFT